MKAKNFDFLPGICGLCFLLLLAFTQPTLAQQAAGAITGTVVDSTGAAIASAKVTAHDVDRGTVWTTKTSSAGVYNLPQVAVGNIEVKVEAQGFSTELRKRFSLVVDQVATVDFRLSVGAASATVEVTTAPPLLQSDSTEISTLLDANAVSNLPLASRDVNQLTLLAPGVISPNIFAFQSAQTTFGTGRPYVNGAREQDNNFTLDGMDVNQADNNDVAYVPNPDAVQNFNIITSNAPADYGNYIGGVIVETTKSGTNHFHGNIFEYFRNTILNANSWQDKANAFLVDTPGSGLIARPVLQWNEFGGTVGGPIVRDKLFFFADFQGMVNNTPRTGETNTVIPSSQSAFLKGDFSALCTSQGATFVNGICTNPALQLYQPAVGVTPINRTPYANNQVPVSSKVASAIIGSPYFAAQEQQSTYYESGYIHTWQGDVKIDWQASPKDHVIGRYTQMYTINQTSYGADVLTPNVTREYPLKNAVLTWDRAITPTFVNEARVGGQMFPANDQVYTNSTGVNFPQQFNIPGVPGNILPLMNFGYQAIGSANDLEVFHDHTIQLSDTVTWTHGRQEVHAGFEWYKYIMNDIYPGNNGASGQFSFSGQYTGNIGTPNAPGTSAGNAFADFLLGLPATVQQGVPLDFHLRNSLFAGFVSDTYKITPNVTIIAGLRYELVTARGDKDANNNINFDLITGQPEIGKNYNTYSGPATFQPRIGLSWRPSWDHSTVFRAAYDISSYMEGNGVNNMAVVNPPNILATSITNIGSTNLPSTNLDQGYSSFSTTCTAAQLVAFAPNCIAGFTTHATNPHLQPAVDQQWNFAFEHQFPGNTTVTIGYVGNKIDHLADIYWYNQKVLTENHQVIPGPYMTNLVAAGVGQARYNNSDGISRYNALQTTVSQRAFHGLDYQFSYTWSKCMTNNLGYFGSYGDEEGIGESQTQATQNFFQNEYDPMGDYGRCTTDVASYFAGYAVYNLPFGRGKAIGNNVNAVVNQIIGGWQLAGDVTLHTGFGITPFAGSYMGDQKTDGLSAAQLTAPSYTPRPDCVVGVSTNQPMQTVQIGSSIGKVNLNPAAVTEVQDYQFGDCKTGSFRGPGLATSDLSVIKHFSITEGINLAFQGQFINLTNTPIFSVPASWWGQYSSCGACNAVRTTGPSGGNLSNTTGLFGLLDGSNPGRQVELSAKINF